MPPISPLQGSNESTPPAAQPGPGKPATKPAKKTSSWRSMKARANTISGVMVLLLTLLALGAVGGWLVARSNNQPATKSPTVQSLTPDDLSKLSQSSNSLGSSGQVLSIGADTLFRAKVDVGGDLSVTGRLNANGPVVLSQLNITGAAAVTGLNVGTNLTVGGTTTLQKSLTVGDLVTINSGLNVSGTASISAINANTISVRTLSISGPIIVGHLQTQGTTPTTAGGTAIGSGGTVSISGNDASGTININTGNTPPAGVLITVVFRTAYTATPHVQLTALTGTAASTPVYVTRSATGFAVHTDTPPPAGSILSFDYFVSQ